MEKAAREAKEAAEREKKRLEQERLASEAKAASEQAAAQFLIDNAADKVFSRLRVINAEGSLQAIIQDVRTILILVFLVLALLY